MPNQSVVTILIVAIFGNLVLMLLLLATLAIRRRNRLRLSASSPLAATEMRRPDPFARIVERQRPDMAPASSAVPADGVDAQGGPEGPPAEGRAAGDRAAGDGEWRDPLTGLEGRLAWERAMREESARLDRYGRSAAVVVAEVDGLGRLADRFGSEPETRIVRAVGDALRRQARATDRVARVDDASFYVLMPETDEISAINYVERVRAVCDRWLESGAVSLRLSLGWASPQPGGDLGTALHVAHDRLNVERRQAGSLVESTAT
jgi:diguanylate cyclase (GGDEF)-like protein